MVRRALGIFGVATVVLKLFNIVQPDIALFGKKDYQQLLVIRQLVAQFNLPLQIVGSEIVREADGLALSSRNQYLSVEQRRQAIQLNQALSWVVQCVEQGERDFSGLEQQASRQLQRSGWQVDYVAIRCQQDLSSPTAETSRLVILAAASLGNTRLLDNIELTLAV